MKVTGNNEKPFCCKASLSTTGNSGGLGYSRRKPQVRNSFPCYLLITVGTVIGKIISLDFEGSHSRINSIACCQEIKPSEGILHCSTLLPGSIWWESRWMQRKGWLLNVAVSYCSISLSLTPGKLLRDPNRSVLWVVLTGALHLLWKDDHVGRIYVQTQK